MPPASARQTAQGGGGGSAGYYSQAELRTDLAPAAIGAHYAASLRAAGWRLHNEGAAGSAIWSMWTFRDAEGDQWRGLLLALRRAEDTGEYVLYLRADANGG